MQLPEKPPIQISYTTPEEIGFAWEEDGIQGIRVTGAEDVLHIQAPALRCGSDTPHETGLTVAGAALYDMQEAILPRGKTVVQGIKAAAAIGAEKITYVHISLHPFPLPSGRARPGTFKAYNNLNR